jgi:hypothetical protein
MVCTHNPRTMPVSTDWLLICIHKVVERCLLLHTYLLLLLLLLLLQSRNCSSIYLSFFLFKKLRTRLCQTKFLQTSCTFRGGVGESHIHQCQAEERRIISTLLQHTLTYWIPLSLLQISYCRDKTKLPTMQKALAVFKIQPKTQRQPCKPCYYNNQPWNLQLKTITKSRRHRMRETKTHKNTHTNTKTAKFFNLARSAGRRLPGGSSTPQKTCNTLS